MLAAKRRMIISSDTLLPLWVGVWVGGMPDVGGYYSTFLEMLRRDFLAGVGMAGGMKLEMV